MNELFPVVAGAAVGVVLASLRPGVRRILGAVCALLVGVTATIVSGEYRVGWEFLLIDVPLAAAGAYLAHRAVAARERVQQR